MCDLTAKRLRKARAPWAEARIIRPQQVRREKGGLQQPSVSIDLTPHHASPRQPSWPPPPRQPRRLFLARLRRLCSCVGAFGGAGSGAGGRRAPNLCPVLEWRHVLWHGRHFTGLLNKDKELLALLKAIDLYFGRYCRTLQVRFTVLFCSLLPSHPGGGSRAIHCVAVGNSC